MLLNTHHSPGRFQPFQADSRSNSNNSTNSVWEKLKESETFRFEEYRQRKRVCHSLRCMSSILTRVQEKNRVEYWPLQRQHLQGVQYDAMRYLCSDHLLSPSQIKVNASTSAFICLCFCFWPAFCKTLHRLTYNQEIIGSDWIGSNACSYLPLNLCRMYLFILAVMLTISIDMRKPPKTDHQPEEPSCTEWTEPADFSTRRLSLPSLLSHPFYA